MSVKNPKINGNKIKRFVWTLMENKKKMEPHYQGLVFTLISIVYWEDRRVGHKKDWREETSPPTFPPQAVRRP